jgi:Flp pilus assembly protein TadD
LVVLSLLTAASGLAQGATDPTDAYGTLAQARQALSEGRASDAAALLNAAAPPSDPDGAAAFHLALGLAELQAGRAESAVEPLRAALELKPDLAGARVALARAYAVLGDPDKPELHLRRALAVDADDGRRRSIKRGLAALRSDGRWWPP